MKRAPYFAPAFALLLAVTGLALKGGTVIYDKPKRFLQYITCKSRTCFDTGVTIASGQTVEMKVATLKSDGTLGTVDFICNKAAKDADIGKVIQISNLSAKMNLIVNGTTEAQTALTWKQTEDVVLTFDATSGALSLKANGTVIGSSTATLPASAGTWQFFGLSTADVYASFRLYYARIRDAEGKLLADFRPCICRGQVALYDTVSKATRFHTGDGNGNVHWLVGPGATTDKTTTLDYAQLSYSAASIDARLDTGVSARSGTKVEATVMVSGTSGDFGLVGARNDKGRFMPVHVYAGKFWCGYGGTSNGSTLTVQPNTVYTVVSDFHCGSQTIAVDGETVYTGTSTENVDIGVNLTLFATYHPNGGYIAPNGSRIMRVKIWQGNADGSDYTLVRDYTPIWQDGYFGFRDSASGTHLDMKAGCHAWPETLFANVQPESYLQYVESFFGSQIDTGVVAADGIKAELDLTRSFNTIFNGGEYPVLSVPATSSKTFDLFGASGNFARFRYNGTDVQGPIFRTGERQLVVSELYAGSQRLTIDGTVCAQASLTGYSGTDTLRLFGRSQTVSASVRLYGLKIWKGAADGSNPVLVRDFRPAICGGRVALYDVVGKKAYFDSMDTRGFLVAGPRIGAKPKFYRYLTGPGHQFLDTGVIGKTPIKTEIDMTFNAASAGTYMSLLGARNAGKRIIPLATENNTWQLAYGAQWWNMGSGACGTHALVVSTLEEGKQEQIVNGVTVSSGTLADPVDTGYTLYAFARNFDGVNDCAKADCWSIKIYRNDELVRAFHACRLDGHSGFWDDVTESFFPCGSFPFTQEQEFGTGPRIPVGLMMLVR